MSHQDIEEPELGELSWSATDRPASLSTVYRHAIGSAKEVERWYAEKRRTKRPWGRALRVGAIVLAGIAAILPVVSEISAGDGTTIAPGWSTVALGVAAVLVALDRFFGFSSGWMRFMATDLRVKQLRHGFEYTWQRAQLGLADPRSDADVAGLLAIARDFAISVDQAVAEETGTWTTEFSSILEKTERAAERSDHS